MSMNNYIRYKMYIKSKCTYIKAFERYNSSHFELMISKNECQNFENLYKIWNRLKRTLM